MEEVTGVKEIPREYAWVVEQTLVNLVALGYRFISANGEDMTDLIATQGKEF